MNDLLDRKKVEEILGVNRRTLIRWEKKGILVSQRTSGGHRRYTQEQINQFKAKKACRKRYIATTPADAYLEYQKQKKTLKDDRRFNLFNYFPIDKLQIGKYPAFPEKMMYGKWKLFIDVLSPPQRRVVFGFISLLLVTGFLVVGTKSAGMIGGIWGIRGIGGINNNIAIKQYNNKSSSVLAETTVKPNFVFNVGVPATFKENAEFLKDLTVQGKMVLTEGIEAPNVVTSLTAGSGLSVTGGANNPTIANTGVLSLGGSTGALSLKAGTGITIDGLTITNSSPATDAKAFKTIKVGSDSFSAGSADTLEFVAGTGITLSSDTTNKKLTLAAGTISAAGGWTDGGTDVYLTTTTDNVGIGTLTPSYKLDVAGNLNLSTGSTFKIAATDVLSATTLGTGVTTSSLTTVGALSNGSIATGFGNISTANTIATTGTMGSAGNTTFTGSTQTLSGTGTALTLSGAGTSISFSGAGLAQITTGTSQHLALMPGGNVGIGTTAPTSKLFVAGSTIIAPSTDNTTSLTLRATSGSSSSNIFDITNAAGTTSYFSIDSSGQLSGSAFQLVNMSNTVVGTAIEGGWTLGSYTYSYRRRITVNNTSGSTLPTNYQVSITLSGSDSLQTHTQTKDTSTPYKDFRIGYGTTTISEIARNVTNFDSSNISFNFLTQTQITNGNSDNGYYIYYDTPNLSLIEINPSTYDTSSISLDTANDYTTWSSADSSNFIPSQDGTDTKVLATTGKVDTLATTGQGQLTGTPRYRHAQANVTVNSTDYLYEVGGKDSNGADTSTVYKASITTGTIGSFSSTGANLPNVSGASTVALNGVSQLSGYNYRKAITIDNSSNANTLTNYQVSITTDTSALISGGKMNSNCSDIRITDTDGSTLLDHWLASGCNSSSTLIWAEVPSISASSTKTIYLYYGNSGASTASSGRNTFIAWDDFDGGSEQWTTAGGISIDRTTNKRIDINGTTGQFRSYLDKSSDIGNFRYDYTYRRTSTAGYQGFGAGVADTISNGFASVNNGAAVLDHRGSSDPYKYLYIMCQGSPCGGNVSAGSDNTIYYATLTRVGDVFTEYVYTDAARTSQAWTLTYTRSGLTNLRYIYSVTGAADNNVTATGWVDDIIVRKYTSPEPTTSIGSESMAPTIYVIGGMVNDSPSSTVYKAAISSSDGTIGNFSSQANGLVSGTGLASASAMLFTTDSSSNYIYVFGGRNSSGTDVTTVQRSLIDSSADVGAFSTASQGQFSSTQRRSSAAFTSASIGGVTYVYLIGGKRDSTTLDTIVRASIDSTTGNVSSWTTDSYTLPVAVTDASAVIATVGSDTYLYVFGGQDGNGTSKTTIYKAPLDANGAISDSFIAQGTIPSNGSYANTALTKTVSGTPYVYIIGGNNGTTLATVYKAQLTTDMSNYKVTSTFSSQNLSTMQGIQFVTKSSYAGSYMSFEFKVSNTGVDATDWKKCDSTGDFDSNSVFAVTTGWVTKTCMFPNGTTLSAVQGARFKVYSNPGQYFTFYLDNVIAATNLSGLSINAPSVSTSSLGAANLSLNAQGTGAVFINYDTSNALAGTGGLKVFDGAAGEMFSLNSTGDASASGSLVLTGASGSATPTIDILNGKNLIVNTSVGGDGGLTARLTLLNGGNLGIGTTNPAALLHVAGGNVRIGAGSLCVKSTDAACAAAVAGAIYASNTTVQSADVAENYVSSEELEPGDVVVMAEDGNSLSVKRSTVFNRRNLLGVVSTKPGVTLNSDAATDSAHPYIYPIALMGRVPVKVSTESGMINTGDYLTVSISTEGAAMKAKKAGHVIGKALEPYTGEGIGKVMTLINISFADPQADETEIIAESFVEDVLGEATQSAVFKGLNPLEGLNPQEAATVSGNLAVLGRTTLNDLGVTGTINTGLLTINGMNTVCHPRENGDPLIPDQVGNDRECADGATINTLSGNLYLQSEGLGGIDIMAGKVVIDTKGNIKTEGNILANTIEAEEIKVISNSIGTATIPAGKTFIEIQTVYSTDKSRIFITPNVLISQQLSVTKKQKGSFRVEIKQAESIPIIFDWWIVN